MPITDHIELVLATAIFICRLGGAHSQSTPPPLPTTLSCTCKVGALLDLEHLNANARRTRLEHPNGVVKYTAAQHLTPNSLVDCHALAVYALLDTADKRCRRCTMSGWSDLRRCDTFHCDLDTLSGDFLIKSVDPAQRVLDDQNLFAPGRALAVYRLFDGRTACKWCGNDGEWSARPSPALCVAPKPRDDCSLATLKQLEYQQFDYIRIRVEAASGLVKIDEREVLGDRLPSGTVVLYQKYLSALNIAVRRRVSNGKVASGGGTNYFNPFTKKFCRYCNDGAWSEIESCVSLSCDKDRITGSPELIFVNGPSSYTSSMDRRYGSDAQAGRVHQNLFKPHSVLAIYTYGTDRFCKQCHENGEWSKYALNELCKRNTSNILANLNLNINYNYHIYEDIYTKERKCTMRSLEPIELHYQLYSYDTTTNLTRLYFISPDRKQKFQPDRDALIPSRTLLVYQSPPSTIRLCSACLDGAWSNISADCTRAHTNLNMCERSRIHTPDFIRKGFG